MIPNRRSVVFSLALHLVGALGLLALAEFSAPMVSLNPPLQTIDVRFPQPPHESSGHSAPVVSRETPRPRATPRHTVREKSKPRPKPTARPRPTPKRTSKPRHTERPRPTHVERRPTPKPHRTEPPPAHTAPPPPPQPTRTYYPQPPREPEKTSPASSPRRPEPKAPSDPAPATGLSPSGAKQGALIGVRGGPSLNAYYSQQAIALIAGNFKVPTEMQSDVTCVIGFYILSDGRIVDPSILHSSGNVDLDALALEALKKTERLPPLPDEFRSRSVEAQLTFSFTPSSAGN